MTVSTRKALDAWRQRGNMDAAATGICPCDITVRVADGNSIVSNGDGTFLITHAAPQTPCVTQKREYLTEDASARPVVRSDLNAKGDHRATQSACAAPNRRHGWLYRNTAELRTEWFRVGFWIALAVVVIVAVYGPIIYNL